MGSCTEELPSYDEMMAIFANQRPTRCLADENETHGNGSMGTEELPDCDETIEIFSKQQAAQRLADENNSLGEWSLATDSETESMTSETEIEIKIESEILEYEI